MHRSARASILLVLLGMVLVSAAPASIAGPWQFTVELAMGTGKPLVTFKQDGEKITGTYEGRYGKSNLEGTVKDNQVQFTVTVVAEGTTVSGVFTGTYENDRMSGEVDYEGAGDGTWSAVRAPSKP
jgi:hypothetical protein